MTELERGAGKAPDVRPAGPGGDVRTFDELRPIMLGVAYRILGRAADAEDVVQEAWLRWAGVEAAGIREPRAFLVRVVSRLAIDRLRRIRARHETYVGSWLPEPILSGFDLEDRAELRESISMAMLVVLETLSPLERAVFVLREAFELPYGEIAEIVERSEPAVRQLGRRAREHVEARRLRFEVDPGTHRAVTEQFVAAALAGDLDGLLRVLSPGVTFVSDGGGKVIAARVPLEGAERVARFVAGLRRIPVAEPRVEIAEVNAGPGFLIFSGPTLIWAYSLSIIAGRIEAIHAVGNPDKLGIARRSTSAGPLEKG